MDTPPTEIYTLSLHDALPISAEVERLEDGLGLADHGVEGIRRNTGEARRRRVEPRVERLGDQQRLVDAGTRDRKSTRLNSSHVEISYAVFCLKKKKKNMKQTV